MNFYIHKDGHTLGAFFALHLLYHACIFDLTRVTLAGYSFPLANAMSAAPAEFKASHQQKCFEHADFVSQILKVGIQYDIDSLDDHYVPTAAFESTKVQVIYATTLAGNDPQVYNRVLQNINTNLKALVLTHQYADMPNVYVST